MTSNAVARQGVPICEGTVLPEWIDANEHMNVAYYVLAFDQAVDSLWNRFGIDEEYIRNRKLSTFGVECHLTYQGEMNLGDPYVVTAQVLAYDEKRIHQIQHMYHADKGYLAATGEWMNLHVDIESRRVTPWPDEIIAAIKRFATAQGNWPLAPEIGRKMRVKNPRFNVEGD